MSIVPVAPFRRLLAAGLCTWVMMSPVPFASRGPAATSGESLSLFVEPAAGSGPVVHLINQAKKSIRLEVYELTEDSVFQALKAAVHRHVSVRVLLEQHPMFGSHYASAAYAKLQSLGISVKWANEKSFTYTHEKAIDIDNTTAGIFTFNLSGSAFTTNREFGIVDHNVADATQVGAIFQADWNRSPVTLTDKSLVVSPLNSRSSISSLIGHAKHTLDLYEEEMGDTSIEHDLTQAASRGVQVRVIISSQSSGTSTISKGGVHVVMMSSPYVHAKAIVADNSKLFIGSENISATSLDRNREMGIITTNSKAIATVESTFGSDWRANGGASKPPKVAKLTLHLQAEPNVIKRHQYLRIVAQTEPSVPCTITVTYPDGYVSQAQALQGTRTADASGDITWGWHVGSTVTGTAQAAVSCEAVGKSISKTVSFTISG